MRCVKNWIGLVRSCVGGDDGWVRLDRNWVGGGKLSNSKEPRQAGIGEV